MDGDYITPVIQNLYNDEDDDTSEIHILKNFIVNFYFYYLKSKFYGIIIIIIIN